MKAFNEIGNVLTSSVFHILVCFGEEEAIKNHNRNDTGILHGSWVASENINIP